MPFGEDEQTGEEREGFGCRPKAWPVARGSFQNPHLAVLMSWLDESSLSERPQCPDGMPGLEAAWWLLKVACLAFLCLPATTSVPCSCVMV